MLSAGAWDAAKQSTLDGYNADLATKAGEAAAISAEINTESTAQAGEQQRLGELQGNAADLSHVHTTAGEDLAEVRGEEVLAEAEATRTRTLAETFKQAVDQAASGARSWANQLTQFGRSTIEPVQDQIRSTENIYETQVWDWVRRLTGEEEKAKLDAIYKTQLDLGRILSAAFASFAKMNAALLGVSGPAAGMAIFTGVSLNMVERVHATWVETKARLEGLHDQDAANKDRLRRMQSDTHYQDELSRAEQKHVDGAQKRDAAQRDHEVKEAAVEPAEAAREAAYADTKASRDDMQEVNGVIADYNKKIADKRAEQQRISTESGNIDRDKETLIRGSQVT